MSNSEIFSALVQKVSDYNACIAAFKASYQGGQDVLDSARARINHERERDHMRADELSACVNDNTRSETVRRLAAAELEQLEAKRLGVTAAERAAFEDASREAATAIQDAIKLRREIREAAEAADAEVKRLRAASVGDGNSDLYPRWLSSLEDDFKRLGGGSM